MRSPNLFFRKSRFRVGVLMLIFSGFFILSGRIIDVVLETPYIKHESRDIESHNLFDILIGDILSHFITEFGFAVLIAALIILCIEIATREEIIRDMGKFTYEVSKNVFLKMLGIHSTSIENFLQYSNIWNFHIKPAHMNLTYSHVGNTRDVNIDVQLSYTITNVSHENVECDVTLFGCTIDRQTQEPEVKYLKIGEVEYDGGTDAGKTAIQNICKEQYDSEMERKKGYMIGNLWRKKIDLEGGQSIDVYAEYIIHAKESGYLPWFTRFLTEDMMLTIHSDFEARFAVVPLPIRTSPQSENPRDYKFDFLFPLQGFVVAWAPS